MEMDWRGAVGWAIDVRRALEWCLSHFLDAPMGDVNVSENPLGEIDWSQPSMEVECLGGGFSVPVLMGSSIGGVPMWNRGAQLREGFFSARLR